MSEYVSPHSDLVWRHIMSRIAHLPEPQLLLVAEFMDTLAQPEAAPPQRPTVAEVRAEAQRLAAQMAHLPREELLARFHTTLERIRTEAIHQGTALDGELEGG